MGFLAPTVTDEQDAVARFLVQQLSQLRTSAYGLTDEQARLTPTPSALSVLSLLTHVAQAVEQWLNAIEIAPEPRTREVVLAVTEKMGLGDGYFSGSEVPPLPMDVVLAIYDRVLASVPERLSVVDLETRVPVPEAPWFPDDLDSWNARWVCQHLIAEVARHAGHADIIREAIDGAFAYKLNALADGDDWPG